MLAVSIACVYGSRYFMFQDGHEICFVGDEAFRELSAVDPNADRLLDEVSTNTTAIESKSRGLFMFFRASVALW